MPYPSSRHASQGILDDRAACKLCCLTANFQLCCNGMRDVATLMRSKRVAFWMCALLIWQRQRKAYDVPWLIRRNQYACARLETLPVEYCGCSQWSMLPNIHKIRKPGNMRVARETSEAQDNQCCPSLFAKASLNMSVVPPVRTKKPEIVKTKKGPAAKFK